GMTASRAATSARTPSMMESSTVAELIRVAVLPLGALDLHRRVAATTARSITDPCSPDRSGRDPRRAHPRSRAQTAPRPLPVPPQHAAHGGRPPAWLWPLRAQATPHCQASPPRLPT